jgi:hypothetical protein
LRSKAQSCVSLQGVPRCVSLFAAATVFLEIWKRQRAHVVLHWDLYGWDEDQVRQGQQRGLSTPSALDLRPLSECVFV